MIHPNPVEAPSATEEYSMPCAEALLASTLALMIGYVQAGAADDTQAVEMPQRVLWHAAPEVLQ